MVNMANIKFYKSNNNGLGGSIDTSQIIKTGAGDPNNLFPMLSKTERDTGGIRYALMYVKNLDAEVAKSFQFWKSQGGSNDNQTMYWAKGITGKNGNEASIADFNTAPAGVTDWKSTGTVVDFGDLALNDRWGIWFKDDYSTDTPDKRSLENVFRFKITNPSSTGGGTPTDPNPPDPDTGGNTGGNTGDPVADWKIAVVGDSDSNSNTDKVFGMLKNYDKIIMVGDYAYGDPSGAIDIANKYNLKSKVLGYAMGNHEDDDGYTTFCNWQGISTKKTWFMRKFENVAVITCDTNISVGGTQGSEVKGFIDSAGSDPTIDWICLCMHHPWFGSGSDHGYDDANQVEQWHDKISDSKKGMFVFTGHNHNWQRTGKVTYNSSDPEDPNTTDSSSPFVNDTNGIIHVVSGTGGHDGESSLYSLKDSVGSSGNPNLYQNNKHLGIYELIASNGGNTLTCRFKSIDNDIFDTITVTTT